MNLPTASPHSSPEKRLMKLFRKLPEAEQRMVLEFAEFVSGRVEITPREIPQPKPIPRPEDETVIKAMRRLSASYHMLDKSRVLNETSALMAQHVMQGRDAKDVIDELEIVFESHYKRLISENE